MPNTREKLIELLAKAHNATTDACFEKDLTYAEAREIEADVLIANGVTVQKWIPVSERLPEIDQPCLCYKKRNGHTSYQMGTYIGAMLSGDCAAFKSISHYGCIGVTHWMPLPERPKED